MSLDGKHFFNKQGSYEKRMHFIFWVLELESARKTESNKNIRKSNDREDEERSFLEENNREMNIPGFLDDPRPTEEMQQWAGPMFHPDNDAPDTANKYEIENNTNDREASAVYVPKQVEENSEASDVIFDEEEVPLYIIRKS